MSFKSEIDLTSGDDQENSYYKYFDFIQVIGKGAFGLVVGSLNK